MTVTLAKVTSSPGGTIVLKMRARAPGARVISGGQKKKKRLKKKKEKLRLCIFALGVGN